MEDKKLTVKLLEAICEHCYKKSIIICVAGRIEGNPICYDCHRARWDNAIDLFVDESGLD